MEAVKREALGRALKILDALECEYAVIDQDGMKHGELEVLLQKENNRAVPRFPRGELVEYITGFLASLKPGATTVVPFDKYTIDEIRGSITPYCTKHFGRGNYITTRVGDSIEVLRVV